MSNKWFSHFPTSTPESSALRSARIDFELAKTRHQRNDFEGELDALRNSLSTLEEMSIESDDTDTVRKYLTAALVLVSDFKALPRFGRRGWLTSGYATERRVSRLPTSYMNWPMISQGELNCTPQLHTCEKLTRSTERYLVPMMKIRSSL